MILFGRGVFFRFFGSGHQGFAKPSPETAKPNPKTTKPNPETTKPNPDPRNAAPPATARRTPKIQNYAFWTPKFGVPLAWGSKNVANPTIFRNLILKPFRDLRRS